MCTWLGYSDCSSHKERKPLLKFDADKDINIPYPYWQLLTNGDFYLNIMKETLIEKIEKDAEKMMLDYEGEDCAFDNVFIFYIEKCNDGIRIYWRYYYDEGCKYNCERVVKSWREWESLKKKLTELNDVLDAVWSAERKLYKTLDSTGLKKDIVD